MSQKSNHHIVFDGVYNNWSNALPLGNGKFGAMVFFKDHKLHIALNHYDCYYPVLSRYASKPGNPRPPGRTYTDICNIVDKVREDDDYARSHYTDTLYPAQKETRPSYSGTSFPMAGEIVIELCKGLDVFNLKLVIEEGIVLFQASGGGKEAAAKIWLAKTEDGLYVETSESEASLWGEANIIKPSDIGQGRYTAEYGVHDSTCWYRMTFGEGDGLFVAETAVTSTPGCIVASVLPGNGTAISHNSLLLANHRQLAREHAASWDAFWRVRVSLPDYFLETLWYLHLYIIECASGKGGTYPEQACGLNGLWDIRRPSLWGSMWYWDVNIQEAFWPVFSSNQLELGKHFCDSYLYYQDDIEAYTQRMYGVDGWALDYPHTLYNCIQPWCAQFLWQYYSYSGDLDFLRDKAYPVFVKQIEFFKHIAKLGSDGKLHINYDISPEQGPITKDSVITISSVKYLLKRALEAADVLARPQSEMDEYKRLISLLPEYPLTEDGTRWKDSVMAPDGLFYRHPSILMPIFPSEEMCKDNTQAFETLKFAIDNTEVGVFGFGWLASAAAKMGEGTAALRILYEKGLDNLIHSNGMGYEESERFINLCLITKPPIYPPAMAEPSGGIVMAVNTMLLQAGDYIEVFPAIPNGHDRLKASIAQYRHHEAFLAGDYQAWQDCGFDGMLAPGGFEVSAQRRSGVTAWIQTVSLREGILRLLLPAELSPSGKQMVYEKNVNAGEIISFGKKHDHNKHELQKPHVQTRTAAATHRRVFLGEDRHTEFNKAVDSFTCAYLLGNVYRYTMTPYVFDFGLADGDKNYDAVYRKNYCMTGGSTVFFGKPRRIGAEVYSGDKGYGFASLDGLSVGDRAAPDDLRRDFVEGTGANEFWIELPRGKYSMLIISGDEAGVCQTNITIPHIGGSLAGEVVKPGRYQCKIIPFMHECDGVFRIGLSAGEGQKWKLNAVFLSKEYNH